MSFIVVTARDFFAEKVEFSFGSAIFCYVIQIWPKFEVELEVPELDLGPCATYTAFYFLRLQLLKFVYASTESTSKTTLELTKKFAACPPWSDFVLTSTRCLRVKYEPYRGLSRTRVDEDSA